jgi:hypothetical protein
MTNPVLVVPIDSVQPSTPEPSRYDLNKMKLILLRQGQIEPLQISSFSGRIYSSDFHGNAIWYAAKELGWDTILTFTSERWVES